RLRLSVVPPSQTKARRRPTPSWPRSRPAVRVLDDANIPYTALSRKLSRGGRRRPEQGCGDEEAARPHYRHRFPAELISHAVWLYHVFSLSFRDVELLLAERGIVVSYETGRRWCKK